MDNVGLENKGVNICLTLGQNRIKVASMYSVKYIFDLFKQSDDTIGRQENVQHVLNVVENHFTYYMKHRSLLSQVFSDTVQL